MATFEEWRWPHGGKKIRYRREILHGSSRKLEAFFSSCQAPLSALHSSFLKTFEQQQLQTPPPHCALCVGLNLARPMPWPSFYSIVSRLLWTDEIVTTVSASFKQALCGRLYRSVHFCSYHHTLLSHRRSWQYTPYRHHIDFTVRADLAQVVTNSRQLVDNLTYKHEHSVLSNESAWTVLLHASCYSRTFLVQDEASVVSHHDSGRAQRAQNFMLVVTRTLLSKDIYSKWA